MAHIRVYADSQFKGRYKDFYGPTPYVGDDFNDKISSFEIFEGYWEFFVDANFEKPLGIFDPLVQGQWIEDILYIQEDRRTRHFWLPNDTISSLRPKQVV